MFRGAPRGRGETEQNEGSQYLVGVQGLEAGLGRAVEGAGDTEPVVQNLQLRRQNGNRKPREEAGEVGAQGRAGGGRRAGDRARGDKAKGEGAQK